MILLGSVDGISYDVVFLRAILGSVYPCTWPLPVVAIGLAVAGGQGATVSRNRLIAYAIGFVIAFTLLHLYGTPVANWLERHRMVGELALAFLLIFEGLFLLGVQNVWARLRGKRPGEDPASDATTATLLGLGMPFATTLCLSTAALAGASALGDAGNVGAAAAVILIIAVGTALGLLLVGHLAYLVWRRLPPATIIPRIAGGAFVILAILIVLGRA
ncbi:MAG: hypothetical protein M0Z66_08470 [Thermaerobacter sp.]|nr:hypothetical protein [Thermaerobacter sp.]